MFSDATEMEKIMVGHTQKVFLQAIDELTFDEQLILIERLAHHIRIFQH